MANTKIPPELVDDQVFGRRNLIINGNMSVNQRGSASATTLSTTSEIFTLDRFRVEQGTVTGNNGTTEVSTDVPSGQGFTKSLKVTGGSSVSYGTNGFTAINYRGEGQDFNQVLHGTSSAKTVTISFWVKSSVTGTYSLNHTKYDGSTERFNVSEYTISQANTWEYKKINVVGDTSVAASDWIRLYWHLGGDSGHKTATAGTWINGDATKRATSSQPDMITTNGATFFLTGVQFEVGSQATPFEHRSFGEELALCERYFQKYTKGSMRGVAATTGTPSACNRMGLTLRTEMRGNPTVSYGGAFTTYDGNVTGTVNTFGATYVSTTNIEQDTNTSMNTVAGRAVIFYMGNDTKITCDAEL